MFIIFLKTNLQYPDGYEEMMADKEAAKEAAKASTEEKPRKKRKSVLGESTSDGLNTKKAKVAAYKLDKESSKKIDQDSINKKLWDTCKTALQDGKMVW